MRKSAGNCFFPTSLMQSYTNDSDSSLSKNNISNLLALTKTSQAQNQFYSIYPDFLKGGIGIYNIITTRSNILVVDILSEIDIGPKNYALSLFDRLVIEFPHTLRNIKARDGNSFVASSAHNLCFYSYLNGCFSEVLEFSPPHEEQLSSVDICRTDIEICATVKNTKKLYVLGENHKYILFNLHFINLII